MRKILYTMHFRGRMSAMLNNSQSLKTTGTATSCMVSTTVRPSGVETILRASDGDLAFLDSEVRLTGPDSFQEDGTITFGDDGMHVLQFSTLGEGHFAPSPEPGNMAGTSSWRVDGGKGQFAAARGFINSTLTFGDSGEFNDIHCGLIFVPEMEKDPYDA
jgi:hypothetical protein